MIEIPEIFRLPASGQQTSYYSGDDGEIRAGWRHYRFTTSGNLVIDAHTGLMWVREVPRIVPGGSAASVPAPRGAWSASANYLPGDVVEFEGNAAFFHVATLASGPAHGGSVAPDDSSAWTPTVWTTSATNLTSWPTFTWSAALDACNALVYGGFGDWRLPNLLELLSLVNYGSSPMCYSEFPNNPVAPPWYFWSSTTHPGDVSKAGQCYYNSMTTGASAKTSLLYVRPVRTL